MRQYELMVLLHPDLEIDVDTPIAKIEKLVDAAGGKIAKRDNWGKRRLAYSIKHQDFAVYVFFEVHMDPAKVAGFEHTILLAEEVMRHLIVQAEETKPVPAKAPAKVVAGADKEESGDGKEL
jgi:small subunit ribosomal protein S6